ncbi:3-isopropylmalate/(R)-2-methylmalate dehydratase small subunit [Jeotgalicoccus aerolatus]|uniref:3-isopropylmalate dehydratase small subunit n=1 Tax=Jeotgalicoccus aerolatus TaxID=709510 RepID=A0A1G8W038_9STAP|nr:3-isopropylmalate dehydratase small subunit [Jeotgalicoccus aerolatus]SDJ71413.1 3-isopropylmalate/(R)-2-methylmalate dehydratase small subunit [Jeotgalicoccus aerolatus]HJG33164.1 3-isopropylmalate dehydratase small subunit [Jeotgalicoccus aerolatus]
MEAISEHKGKVYPLERSNVDTDQIIPKQFLKRIERTGFGEFVFHNWRFHEDGSKRENFDMDDPKFDGASILVAGDNFGCGSSREHAPWALLDYGYKVIIAPGFADIFYSNAFKNGIILIKMPKEQIEAWQNKAKSGDFYLSVDLEEQKITDSNGDKFEFDIPAYHKEKLINGWDDIALTLLNEDKITAFEERDSLGIR